MTNPLAPLAVPQLPTAVAATTVDSAVMRIGTVTGYASGAVTVAISGTETLVSAAYLTSYPRPVIGDLVPVLRQGATWLVLGALAGAPTDTTVINGSFEDSPPGAGPPDGWDTYDAGPNTAIIAVTLVDNGQEIAGPQTLSVSAATPNSVAHYTSSTAFPVEPDQRWSARAFATATYTGTVTITCAVFFSFYSLAAATYPTTSAPNSPITLVPPARAPVWSVMPASSPSDGIVVPAGALYARVTLGTAINATPAGAAGTVYWDQVIARQVG